MAVKIGSARIDERGKISGGAAGDQTGRELSTQSWYRHSKGWRVFRPVQAEQAEKIALAMERACKNDRIGYDQNERSDLYRQVQNRGFDPAKASERTETDCSALVRVCCAYAGIALADFNTATEAARLRACGKFTELTDGKYTAQAAYLCRGDILVTRTKGHTAVVLSDGDRAQRGAAAQSREFGERVLRNGCEGDDVRQLQTLLIQLGYGCGAWGADGDFGDATQMAVEDFQADFDLEVDGEAGEKTIAALMAAIGGDADSGGRVRIVGGNCFVRSEPNANSARLGTARAGDLLDYLGNTSAEGWLNVRYGDQGAWVSGRYGRLEA